MVRVERFLTRPGNRGRCWSDGLQGHGAVHRTEAFLLVAVEVFGTRVTGLYAGLDHGVEQRVVASLGRGHSYRAFATVVVVRADVAGFGLAEVWQAVRYDQSSRPGSLAQPS